MAKQEEEKKETDRSYKGLAKDLALDKAAPYFPAIGASAGHLFEGVRRAAQIGTVPGAEKMAKAAFAGAKKLGGGLFRKAPLINGLIEGYQAIQAMDPSKAEERLRLGEDLLGQSKLYQTANVVVNTADAMSQYGAVKQQREKGMIEAYHKNSGAQEWADKHNESIKKANEQMFVQADRQLGINSNEARNIQVVQRDPDFDLEARTNALARDYVARHLSK